MDFTENNSRGKRGELLERIDRQNSRFRTAKTTIIKFGLHASFVELESAKSALNEAAVRVLMPLKIRGRSSLVVKLTDLWPACLEFETSTAEDPSALQRGPMHVKYVEAQTSPPVGVV
ncbi:hypothetical protein TNCV_2629451 [Trichonephila clavipes]|uniref:Uncharacterized protein n=1 Tax=Trichonephila clavipes TaxID=2585209 RepID=A0A8X6SKX9_TRICX|nr:hypothetical protein TNCV_2629451 [Trichonephila clavipes]